MQISYNEIRGGIMDLIKQIDFKPELLVIIGKGGLIGGYFLAKELSIENIVVLNYTSYEGHNQRELLSHNEYLNAHKMITNPKKILIFDDLVDSGKTMKKALEYFSCTQDVRTAVLYHKYGSIHTPTYSYKQVGEEWIDFDYEIPFTS